MFERALSGDSRKGVRSALDRTRKRLLKERLERERLESLYQFEQQLAVSNCILGLDEAGRGPLAGPLALGAVILPKNRNIEGLNDSKKISEHVREIIAQEIKQYALAWTVQFIEAEQIDSEGMGLSLRKACADAVSAIENSGIEPEAILLDGNPLRFDPREISVVKGDSRCASIAAASILAKTERDSLMRQYANSYPEYGFERNKGYASADHIAAIKTYGLCPLHRKSFCTSFVQESLF